MRMRFWFAAFVAALITFVSLNASAAGAIMLYEASRQRTPD